MNSTFPDAKAHVSGNHPIALRPSQRLLRKTIANHTAHNNSNDRLRNNESIRTFISDPRSLSVLGCLKWAKFEGAWRLRDGLGRKRYVQLLPRWPRQRPACPRITTRPRRRR